MGRWMVIFVRHGTFCMGKRGILWCAKSNSDSWNIRYHMPCTLSVCMPACLLVAAAFQGADLFLFWFLILNVGALCWIHAEFYYRPLSAPARAIHKQNRTRDSHAHTPFFIDKIALIAIYDTRRTHGTFPNQCACSVPLWHSHNTNGKFCDGNSDEKYKCW